MKQTHKIQENENTQTFINYAYTREIWNCDTVNINNVFSFIVATKIMYDDVFEP